MMKNNIKNKLIPIFLLVISFFFMDSVKAVYSDNQVGTYEDEIKKFPSDYKTKIEDLHKIYPNAIFVAQDRFFDWNLYKEVEVKWDNMLKEEIGNKSLIYKTAQSNYKGNAYNSEKTWYYATESAVSYYMDPRNFLDEKHVFMFESQYFKNYQTLDGVKKILSGTFMDKTCPGSAKDGKPDRTYAEVIMEAAEVNDVSPYMLAARLKQEQGKGTSSLISGTYSGYEGYYNYFNIQASGKNDKDIIENGLKCAKGTLKSSKGTELCKGNNWNSPYASILGGAKFIKKGYIGINDTYNVKGQMTNYLQKWDPYGPKYGGHQYMQNIQAPESESISTYKSYSSDLNFKNYNFIFYLPIYKNMPNSLNESTNDSTNNNIDEIKIGDVNGDGVIDSGDLFKLQQFLIGKIEFNDKQKKSSDTNIDNEINSGDIFKLVQHLIGKINLNS